VSTSVGGDDKQLLMSTKSLVLFMPSQVLGVFP
jgi:hypothetical protein